jgi:phenylalanine-4-hydroxylase
MKLSEINQSTKELKEFNDNYISVHIELRIKAIIRKEYEEVEVQSIYDYIIKNEDYMNLSLLDIQNIVINLEKCNGCEEWYEEDDLIDTEGMVDISSAKHCMQCVMDSR